MNPFLGKLEITTLSQNIRQGEMERKLRDFVPEFYEHQGVGLKFIHKDLRALLSGVKIAFRSFT